MGGRSRALLSHGQAADTRYREAIERLAGSRITVHLARARLLYGEWLRRERRRGETREQLRTGHDMFSRIGAGGFAERARHELRATGETVRKRAAAAGNQELTAQEAQIVRLARDGLSNPEIGARLFLSPRTVQYHLGNVSAIANAVYHATGYRPRELPITVEHLLPHLPPGPAAEA